MKKIALSKGEATIRPLIWKEKKQCLCMAEINGGLIKNSIYYSEAEYIMTDKDKEWIDTLTIEDGEKLRKEIMDMLNVKKHEEQKKNLNSPSTETNPSTN